MLNICYYCEKGIIYGRSHTHHRGVAGGRWKKRAPKTRRIFSTNLVRLSIIEDGQEKNVKLCTKCLKRINKDMIDGKRPFLKLTKIKTLKKKETPTEKNS